jgi:Holliday junction resolvasome RuvABC DNA-binding subunit
VGASSATSSLAATGAHVDAANATTSAGTGTHVGAASKLDAAILHTQAKAALTGLGWKPAIAHAAIAAAVASAQGAEVTLERLIFESLRRCPAPRA